MNRTLPTVYYSKDTNHDDIPDKYQITFTYVSASADKGTVTGTTSEVATAYEITRDSVTGRDYSRKWPDSTASDPAIYSNSKSWL